MTPAPTPQTKRGLAPWTTRDLLVIAVIALVSAMVLYGLSLIYTPLAAVATPLIANALLGGLFFLPSALAIYVTRRPGAAFLAQVLASLAQIPFSPLGLGLVIGGVIGGVLAELPFFITRYRRFSLRFMMLAGAIFNVLNVLISGAFAGGADLTAGVIGIGIVLTVLSGAAGGWLACSLAHALVRAGVFGSTTISHSQTTEI
jgi:energy-coupling factor transport system substrate-specific component